jgi:hypothetical protein
MAGRSLTGFLSVADALKNRFVLTPASGSMIKRTGKGDSQLPGQVPFPDHLAVDIESMSKIAHRPSPVNCLLSNVET